MVNFNTEKLDYENQSQFLDREKESSTSSKPIINVIGSPVTALSFDTQIKTILKWASNYESRFVCIANVHMLMEAHWNSDFSLVLKNADMVAPDGMPLGVDDEINGSSPARPRCRDRCTVRIMPISDKPKYQYFFLGSEESILEKMRAKLEQEFPSLEIADMVPLPFRPLTSIEDDAIVQKIHQSKAALVFVSLGCPKQEYWMHEHQKKIQAVMIGLGGAFPVLAGIHKKAPLWIQNLGLEWLYRLIQEPRRLWKRYAYTIPPFVWLSLKQLTTSKYQSMNTLQIVEKNNHP